jgi:hypothetical protein
MNEGFRSLLEDIDLVIRSKEGDLRSSLLYLVERGDSLKIRLEHEGMNGSLPDLATLQDLSVRVDRICEELMTLLTVRKRIQVHSTAAGLKPSGSGVLCPDLDHIP